MGGWKEEGAEGLEEAAREHSGRVFAQSVDGLEEERVASSK